MLYGFSGSSWEDKLVGRGNLNQACIYLKEKEKFRLTIFVEYYLEYQATGFEPRIPIC